MHTSSTSVRSWSAHVPVRRGRSPARRRSAQGVRSATTAPMRGRDWDKRMMADRGDEVVKAVAKLCRRQSQMSIIEAVRKYLQTCPLLKGGTLNVGFPAAGGRHLLGGRCAGKAGPQGVHGRIQPAAVPVRAGDPHLLRRVCPPAARQPVLSRSLPSGWTSRTEPVRSPISGTDETPEKLEVTTSGYVFAPDTDTARYQIQCRLSLFQKRRTINETFRTDEESHAEHEL